MARFAFLDSIESMPHARSRLVVAATASAALGCLIAAGLQLAPRIRLGGSIEGVQWVQAAGAMFWAMPLIGFALVGAAAGHAIAVTFLRDRRIASAVVGAGAVSGAAAFVAVGTPWYEAADGVALQSFGLALAVFAIAAGAAQLAYKGPRRSTQAS